MNDNALTLENFNEIFDALRPVLYYGLYEFAERGQIYLCHATNWSPRFIIFHPDDLDELKRRLSDVRLIPLKGVPSESIREAVKNRLTKMYPKEKNETIRDSSM